MRRLIPLSIAAALLFLPGTILAQDEPIDEEQTIEEVTTYACVAVAVAPGEDPTLAILSGDFEVVSNDDCHSGAGEPAVGPFEPLLFQGKGERKTKPFTLPEGDYEFVVKFKGRDDCDVAEIRMFSVEDGYIDEFSGNDYSFGIEEDRYYLEGEYMGAKCSWTVRIKEFME